MKGKRKKKGMGGRKGKKIKEENGGTIKFWVGWDEEE